MSLATPVLSKSVLPKAFCFTQASVLPKAPGKAAKTARKTSTQAALKAQPDADKTLNMILSRLDDMKAEERSPSTFAANPHFPTYDRHLGPGQPARRRDRGKRRQSLKETGIKSIHIEGLPNCDWC